MFVQRTHSQHQLVSSNKIQSFKSSITVRRNFWINCFARHHVRGEKGLFQKILNAGYLLNHRDHQITFKTHSIGSNELLKVIEWSDLRVGEGVGVMGASASVSGYR